MAAPTIVKGSDHFFNAKWTGNGGGLRVGKFVPYTDNGTVSKSCIFNDGSSSYLSRTHSASNKKTFTFSAWIKRCVTGAYQRIFNATDAGDNENFIFRDTDVLQFYSGDASADVKTNRTFEDTSKFYHIVLRVDTTQSTASDRVRIYVDGEEITSLATATYPSQDADTAFNGNVAHDIGRSNSSSQYFDGYMAEVNFADGQSYGPDTFGLTDTSTGRWIPKSLGSITYGTNGFRLTFANSAGQTIGDDTSGNGNDFTVSNLAATDITTDSPTQNFAVLDPLRSRSGFTFEEGNRKLATGNNTGLAFSTQKVLGTKFYFEAKLTGFTSGGGPSFGIAQEDTVNTTDPGSPGDGEGHKLMGYYSNPSDSAILYRGSYYNDSGNGASVNDWIQLAFDGTDIGNQKVYIGRNNTFYYEDQSKGSFNAARPTFTFDGNSVPDARLYLSNRSGSSPAGSSTWENINFGSYSYNYTAPTGFGSLNQDNLIETTKGIPDFVWIKDRSNSYNHELYDTTRGTLNRLTAENDVEAQIDDGLQKFLKGGFQIEDRPGLNTLASDYISWNWLANGGTTSANTDGSGATIASTIQANQTAGFSIVQGRYFEGSLAHGLSQAPEWILYKETDPNVNNWYVWHKDLTSENYYMLLGTSAAQVNYGSNLWNITSTKFGKNLSLGGTRNAIAYCWHGVTGYSKFGKYTANNSADGPFIYTGFKPSWLLIKSLAAISWYIFDNERNQINPVINAVNADVTNAEHSNQSVIDFLSNGFKIKNSNSGSGASVNSTSHDPYIYCAFAEHPFVGDGTNPCTAR